MNVRCTHKRVWRSARTKRARDSAVKAMEKHDLPTVHIGRYHVKLSFLNRLDKYQILFSVLSMWFYFLECYYYCIYICFNCFFQQGVHNSLKRVGLAVLSLSVPIHEKHKVSRRLAVWLRSSVTNIWQTRWANISQYANVCRRKFLVIIL